MLWVPFYKLNVLSVTTRYCHAVELSITVAFDVSWFSNPNGFISAASGKVLAVCAPCYAFNFIFMAFYLFEALESIISSLPYTCCSIEAGTGQHLARWMPCEMSDSPLVSVTQHLLLLFVSIYWATLTAIRPSWLKDQIMIFLSDDELASSLPSGLQVTLQTLSSWPPSCM